MDNMDFSNLLDIITIKDFRDLDIATEQIKIDEFNGLLNGKESTFYIRGKNRDEVKTIIDGLLLPEFETDYILINDLDEQDNVIATFIIMDVTVHFSIEAELWLNGNVMLEPINWGAIWWATKERLEAI